MAMRISGPAPRVLGVVCAWAALAAAGCGGPRHVPVSGTATVEGKPLAGLVISFNPDPARGNDARVSCVGRIGADGKFSLISDDGFKVTKGARLGWYKVTVSAPDDGRLPVHKKYTDFRQTDLSVEVVAEPAPGAYELKFSR
jgi:hypothetical protein